MVWPVHMLLEWQQHLRAVIVAQVANQTHCVPWETLLFLSAPLLKAALFTCCPSTFVLRVCRCINHRLSLLCSALLHVRMACHVCFNTSHKDVPLLLLFFATGGMSATSQRLYLCCS